jgi:hypothetical protein
MAYNEKVDTLRNWVDEFSEKNMAKMTMANMFGGGANLNQSQRDALKFESAKLKYIIEQSVLDDLYQELWATIRVIVRYERYAKPIRKIEEACKGHSGYCGCKAMTDRLYIEQAIECYTIWRRFTEKSQERIKQRIPYAIRRDDIIVKWGGSANSDELGLNVYLPYFGRATSVAGFPSTNLDEFPTREDCIETVTDWIEDQKKRLKKIEEDIKKYGTPEQQKRWEEEKKAIEQEGEGDSDGDGEIMDDPEEIFTRPPRGGGGLPIDEEEAKIKELIDKGWGFDEFMEEQKRQDKISEAFDKALKERRDPTKNLPRPKPQEIVKDIPDLPSAEDLARGLGKNVPKSVEEFRTKMDNLTVSSSVEKKLYSDAAARLKYDRIAKMSDAELAALTKKLGERNKLSRDILLANMKDEIAASEQIDAIRKKYPNAADAVKRDTESFAVWREHISGVQKRLGDKLAFAVDFRSVDAFAVAAEYVATADDVLYLPPVGYGDKLKTRLAQLEKK